MQAGLQVAVGGLQLLPIATILQAQTRAIQRAANRVFEHRQIFERLDQIVGGAQTQRLHGIAHNTGTRDHDDRQVDLALTDLADQFQAVHLRHAQVADHEVGLLGFEELHTLRPIGGLQHTETTVIQIGSQAGSNHIVVVYDQQRRAWFMHVPTRRCRQDGWRIHWPGVMRGIGSIQGADGTPIRSGFQADRQAPLQVELRGAIRIPLAIYKR